MKWYLFGIRQRVLIITLLPLTMITCLLGGYFINTRLDDAQSALIEKGQIMAQMMATSAEFGLLVGNTEILTGLIKSSTKGNEVDDVVFLTPAFETLVRGNSAGKTLDKNAGYPLRKNNQVYFLHPVIATGVDISDTPGFLIGEQEPEFLGWVVIILSEKPTQARQFEILLKGIILAFIGLLSTFFIASRFGQRITNPILGLTHVVEMLQHGHLETRASLSSTGELRSLAKGINKLAQRAQESNKTLESRVDKATKRLRSTLAHLEKQNQALDSARKNADSANIAKDEFLARMSHELRTPLTSVSGFARLLDQTELESEQKEYSRIINLTSGLLLSIIDDILDYSKLESNAVELENIPFEFEGCIIDVLEMQTAAAHEKGLELITNISPETPAFILGDPIRLKQIISNLVSNAVKFTQEGYVYIQVEVKNKTAIETTLQITIEDTGAGISQDRIGSLFQAFSQADTSITRRFGGSGLGLVIAKRLTELMKGKISLTSKEGKGTQITLNIPFAISSSLRLSPARHIGSIILFDKEPLVRQGIKQQLTVLRTDIIEVATELDILKQQAATNSNTVIWGLNTKEVSKESIQNIQSLLQSFTGTLILLSANPLPLHLTNKVIQLRKPPRTQLLLNALSPESYQLPPVKSPKQAILLKEKSTILVAEDNDFNRLLIRKILEQSNINVLEAITGEEAIQQTIKHHPDLILMDVHMPIIDGIEATRQIRLTNDIIPIIALTANVITSEHQTLTNAGVNHILLKPINDYELCHTIKRYLSNKETPLSLPSNKKKRPIKLEKYKIDRHALTNELNKQITGLNQGFNNTDIKLMRHHCHQLLGLSGLYQLPELEAAGYNLHDALCKSEYKNIWKALSQIQRIIKNNPAETLESL